MCAFPASLQELGRVTLLGRLSRQPNGTLPRSWGRHVQHTAAVRLKTVVCFMFLFHFWVHPTFGHLWAPRYDLLCTVFCDIRSQKLIGFLSQHGLAVLRRESALGLGLLHLGLFRWRLGCHSAGKMSIWGTLEKWGGMEDGDCLMLQMAELWIAQMNPKGSTTPQMNPTPKWWEIYEPVPHQFDAWKIWVQPSSDQWYRGVSPTFVQDASMRHHRSWLWKPPKKHRKKHVMVDYDQVFKHRLAVSSINCSCIISNWSDWPQVMGWSFAELMNGSILHGSPVLSHDPDECFLIIGRHRVSLSPWVSASKESLISRRLHIIAYPCPTSPHQYTLI